MILLSGTFDYPKNACKIFPIKKPVKLNRLNILKKKLMVKY